MRPWAWVWAVSLALLGWAPAMVIAYVIALALATGAGWPGATVFGVGYAVILGTVLFLLVQVRAHFSLTAWFAWVCGGALLLVWGAAYLLFTSAI